MKRRLVRLLSVFLLLAVAFTPARAEQEIQVFVNGVQLDVETAAVHSSCCSADHGMTIGENADDRPTGDFSVQPF